MHKHVCAPRTGPPRGACMALVPRCDTNQGRWGGPFVMQTPIASCLIQMSAPRSFASPSLSPGPSNPRLQPPSPGLSPPSQVQVNPLPGRRGSLREPRPPPRQTPPPLPGGQPVSRCVGLFPGPAKTISYSNVTIRPLTHWGLFMAAAPGRGVKMVI